MKVIKTIPEMQSAAEELRHAGKKIGFVPTMGYLHEGHLSLIRLARRHSDVVVVSIYVNPTQFAPNEDFNNYPRDFRRDESLCRDVNVDIIFYPDDSDIYPETFQTFVITEKLSQTMCGRSRPQHFRGVTTIVCKLFNIVRPHVAVFGRKDAQQALIIQRMVMDLNMNIEVIAGPIIREKDGLAMSSRNKYLTATDRRFALTLNRSLQNAEQQIRAGNYDAEKIRTGMHRIFEKTEHVRIDYIEIVDYEQLRPVKEIRENTLIAVAAFVGKVRLIDNILIVSIEPLSAK